MIPTPTTRSPAQVREDINAVENALFNLPRPVFIDLSLAKANIDRCHANTLTAVSPQDIEEAKRMLALANQALISANETNASYEQRERDRKVLISRRGQLQKELEQAEIQERCHLRREAEEALALASAGFKAQAEALCREFARMVALANRCASYGHKPALPSFSFSWMRTQHEWDAPVTSEQIQNGTLVWLNAETGNTTQKASPITVGALPLPANL